jgi:hypothetical protein
MKSYLAVIINHVFSSDRDNSFFFLNNTMIKMRGDEAEKNTLTQLVVAAGLT